MGRSDSVPSLRYQVFRLRLAHTWTLAGGSMDFKDTVFVKVRRDGVEGLGEAAPSSRFKETPESVMAFLEKARPLLENADWSRHSEIAEALKAVSPGEGAAKAALDMALLDWNAKKRNLPLYRYLGLDRGKTVPTSFSIGIDTPEAVRRKVNEAAAFPILKIKVGRKEDRAMIDAVRSQTDKPLRIDANEGWKDKETALENIRWMKQSGVELIEQPMPVGMAEDIRWLHERSELPIVADEAVMNTGDVPGLKGLYDGLNIKLMKCGGIHEALRMAALARALGLKIMIGCMIESSLAIAAAAHIASVADWLDLDGNLLLSNDPAKGHPVLEGRIVLNDRPGLGVELNPDF